MVGPFGNDLVVNFNRNYKNRHLEPLISEINLRSQRQIRLALHWRKKELKDLS